MIATRAHHAACRLAAALALAAIAVVPACAASKRTDAASRAIGAAHRVAPKAVHGPATRRSVARAKFARSRGYQPMYSDGIGSAVGFHPGPYADDEALPPGRPSAWRPYRRSGVRETMAIDLLTRSNGYAYGYPFP